LRKTNEQEARKKAFRLKRKMGMRKPAEYGNDEVPIPVFYVLQIYEGTFRHEKPIVEIGCWGATEQKTGLSSPVVSSL
jgi:hypothetical protein